MARADGLDRWSVPSQQHHRDWHIVVPLAELPRLVGPSVSQTQARIKAFLDLIGRDLRNAGCGYVRLSNDPDTPSVIHIEGWRRQPANIEAILFPWQK